MNLSTYRVEGKQFFGAVTDDGMIALSPIFPQ